uniref:Uncharacterized protein n=1 Tax=viral metagenome TaxID=1070528 RepID=A0A6M3IFR5_9ZZZZ
MIYEKYGATHATEGHSRQSDPGMSDAPHPPRALEEINEELKDLKEHIQNIREKAGGLAAYLVGYLKEPSPEKEKQQTEGSGALSGILGFLKEQKRTLVDISAALEAILRQTEIDR